VKIEKNYERSDAIPKTKFLYFEILDMMRYYLIGIIFLSCFFSISESRSEVILTQEQKQKVAKIDSVLNFYHEQGILNGTVLVAEAGKVIYQKGFGYANMDTKEKLEPKSVFRLASVSKQFTAMCIMMLEEQSKLNYDDNFQKYILELKYEGVTIRHLLWHTSGMPDYLDFMSEHYSDDEWYVNDDVIKTMAKHHPEKDFEPGERYEYSNTGYLLLASIVERVSGISFKEFLHQNIFDKIGMSSSIFPFGKKEFDEMANRVRGYNRTKDGEYVDNDYTDFDYDVCGDGGIFSNVIDLFKWNEALYTEKLVKQETIQEAYKPYVLNDGSVGDYGFGWNLYEVDSNKVVDHSGSWIGFRTHILRDITNKHCVIILTNVGNRNGTQLYNACYNILIDKPYLRIIKIK
jgi:CubicO group peptidase (beta-lactamase class C family)